MLSLRYRLFNHHIRQLLLQLIGFGDTRFLLIADRY